LPLWDPSSDGRVGTAVLPRATRFALDGRAAQRMAGEETIDIATAHVMMALVLERQHRRNDRMLERLSWSFTIASAMLVLQIALWGLALAVR
jgi:hypothetical protein